MEFRFLSEDLEWEGRRIAAALGMQGCECRTEMQGYDSYIDLEGRFSVELAASSNQIDLFRIEGKEGSCEIFRPGASKEWTVVFGEPQAVCNLMARALYCLGFEDENLFADLRWSLNNHEKMEARLFMPREFWPQTWLDEET